MQRKLLSAIPLIGVAVLGWYAMSLRQVADSHGGQIAKPQPVIPVRVAQAQRSDVPVYLTGLGSVQAANSVLIRSRVDGEIVKIDFQEGQEVRTGDVLAEIDPQPFEAVLEQARATREKDEALLENAKLDLARYQQLMKQDSVARQQLDTTAALERQLESQVKVDQAQIDQAKLQLEYSRIRSPIDGRAGVRLLDIGNIVHATDANGIVIVNQTRPIFVTFSLPASSFTEIREAFRSRDISVLAEDRDGHELGEGRLSVVDNQINQATSTITYKASFHNAEELLWPGLFVNVRVALRTYRDALTVPAAAVQQGPDDRYVFVVDKDQVVEKRSIAVSFSDDAVAVVTSGVLVGDQVVTDGQSRIEAGSHVALLPRAE